jgi:hypothetical protein
MITWFAAPLLENMNMIALPIDPATVDTRMRFERLAAEWKEQARYLSSTTRMAMLQPYQRIIGMGMPVVPLILEELRREPHHWFWALEAITEENPVPTAALGKTKAMADAWIKWGIENGLISE